MEQPPPVGQSFIPAAPPTIAGALPQPVVLTKWPTVLGVIAIILGILGVLGGIWGMMAMTAMRGFMKNAPPETLAQMEAMNEAMKPWTVIGSGLGAAIAVLLLVAGVGLVKRRRWGVSTSRGWAVLKMLFVLVNIIISWHIQETTLAANPTFAASSPGGGFLGVIKAVTFLLVLAWGWALPVFVLIWLGRTKIKNEVAGWK